MSTTIPSTLTFDGRFAREFEELAVPWQAEEAPAPQLPVMNEALAKELGLDAFSLLTPTSRAPAVRRSRAPSAQ